MNDPGEPSVLEYGSSPGFFEGLGGLFSLVDTKACPIIECAVLDPGCESSDETRYV